MGGLDGCRGGWSVKNLIWSVKSQGILFICGAGNPGKHDTGFSIRPVVFVSSYCIQIINRYIIKLIINISDGLSTTLKNPAP